MVHVWRRWHRQWHGSVLAALRSSRSRVDVLADRKQPALSRVYGWIIDRKRRREACHTQRIALPYVPVLSVGNVTFGATGKTPFVQFLIDYVLKQAKEGQVPLLLSRGYGDDEWRMLAKQFPSCQMALGADRVAVGAAKVKRLGGESAPLSCVVVDDGLQQWRLSKDLEIVMVDALHPLGNGLLLPFGSLRELPREALARADVVVVHHADLLDGEELKMLMNSLQTLLAPQRHSIVATSRMKVALLSANNSILVVCGVGNPESVMKVVEKLAHWARVELKAFPDHHAFTLGDVDDILEWVRELQQNEKIVVVTTEKDIFRSPRAMRILADNVELRVLRCELELQHNRDKVKERINALLNLG
ncbi:tetraacyldisaccharide 4'-kinase, putative [Phytophthora infestans T30-4]|uniref:tetraacyldisaccharide 4'-kinase n=1 Tax=Phytophthora infestans (strain T30-4) TaxID=403677 RepID=D0MZ38_PHYIT|nr:tetraacyldisaccharide 4'-kinase, putative [Phytophthora infestans T30-4]EEY66436.1 tetraacyldisaccharide 4'-kinase, putative [Phytophthora infestans T30-4]|eukprot:XP_002907035.1 tetraacyldisaccharide 4'-kinase, putative [Phytophthora infestans T30-4]